jgi:dephospho-CoA kinase
MHEAEAKGVNYFIYEAAILLNEGRPPELDLVIWVEAPRKVLVERAVKRSKITTIEAEKRLHLQHTLSNVLLLIDLVIVNDGSIEHFKSKAASLFHQLKRSKHR